MLAAILICAAPVWATLIYRVHRLPARYNSGARKIAAWKASHGKSGTLNLRNARAGNLLDAEEGAWPAKGQLRLDGFTFGHLGETSEPETSKRKSSCGTIG